MQTKKRAKPVKFGKATKATEAKLEEKEVKVAAEENINSDETKEIKKIIEEKTHPKEEAEDAKPNEDEEKFTEETVDEEVSSEEMLPEQEETTEPEPKEVKLSENPPEKKEEEMPLENTETVTEVEAEELQEKEKSSQFGSFTDDAMQNKPKGGYLKFFALVAFITFIVGVIIIGGISYFSSSMSNDSTMVASKPSPSPTSEPATPTPAKVDLSAYSIKVLNGSGTTGEAAKAKTMLEGKGFTVGSVGNADTSDYTKTEISVKKSVNQAYINALITALKDMYSVNSVVNTSSSQSTDVVVTIGSGPAK